MRLYGPAILLAVSAVWLATVGDGVLFGVTVLAALSFAVWAQVREQQRRSRRRSHGR